MINSKTGTSEQPSQPINIQDKVQSLLRTIDEQAKHIEYQQPNKTLIPSAGSHEQLTKTEAFAIFKDMLAEQGVTSNWKWEDANRVIQNDSLARYNVFRTMADRKQAFSEYQNELRVKEREELREHKEETRQNFIRLLEEHRF